MTNELAIRIITGDVLGTASQTSEAIKMAVKALSLPSTQPERKNGKWITDDLSGIISCSRCGNAAPMETTGGRQYKSKFCQTCGADMRGGQDDKQASTKTINVIKYMADDAQYFVDVEEALNMATNVLTAQPETHDKRTETHARDCISRQAAIDAVIKRDANCGFDSAEVLRALPPTRPEITDGQAIEHLQETGWMQNHDKQMYEMGLREQLADDSDSYDALLPSAQQEPHWIPCSKRLPDHPENDDYYLVTIQCEHYDGWDDYVTGFAEWTEHGWDELSCYIGQIKVVAWMPLPEPYREETE